MMFKCLSDSIDGNNKNHKSVFDQDSNLPSTAEDGPTPFNKCLLTELTIANSSLLSAQALHKISSLEPADYKKFNIPALTSHFNNLFTLAATHLERMSILGNTVKNEGNIGVKLNNIISFGRYQYSN